MTISQAGFVVAAFAVSVTPVTAQAARVTSGLEYSRADFAALREAAAWASLRSDIRRWKDLPDDWDADDGIAPSKHTTLAARAFIDALEACGAPLPVGTIAGDGEISYEWTAGDNFASASFTDDEHFIAFIRDGKAAPLRIDVPAKFGATAEFLTRITTFA